MTEVEENTPGKCGICGLCGPLNFIQKHFLENHVEVADSADTQGEEMDEIPTNLREDNENEDINNLNSTVGIENHLRWSPEQVLLLIRLVEKYQKDFEMGLKKNVWVRISREIETMTGKKCTHEQADNKWKGLKKTYKKIKDHNNKSGNSLKRWEYFNAIDQFMARKPEIEPLATSSIMSSNVSVKRKLDLEESDNTESEMTARSSFISKRKRGENAIQKRHEEKMSKIDKFLELFQLSVEHQIGKIINNSLKIKFQ